MGDSRESGYSHVMRMTCQKETLSAAHHGRGIDTTQALAVSDLCSLLIDCSFTHLHDGDILLVLVIFDRYLLRTSGAIFI